MMLCKLGSDLALTMGLRINVGSKSTQSSGQNGRVESNIAVAEFHLISTLHKIAPQPM